MTREEFYDLYDKISDILHGFKSYHYWYICDNEEYYCDSMDFEVYVHSDRRNDDWKEYWSIDDNGRIHAEDTIYESYEEFLNEWQ